MLAQIDGWKDTVSQWYWWLGDQRIPLWVLAVVVFVYVMTMLELRHRSKRERDMGRQKLPPVIEVAFFEALRKLKIEEQISYRDFTRACRYFGWLGFDRFKKEAVKGRKAEYLKKEVGKRINKLVDSIPAKLPG